MAEKKLKVTLVKSPYGRKVVVDSPHGGNGRQMYLIDISEIVKG